MSTLGLRPAAPGAPVHPELRSRRIRDALVGAAAAAIALGGALATVVAVPKPNFALVLAIILGGLGMLALLTSSRHEVTLTLLTLYLGLLDGPVKLLTGSQGASGVRDVLILVICIGMAIRLSVSGRRVALPPLAGWAIAFAAVVVIEALNPKTGGFLKIVGGFRQLLEWVPFFFFGYMLLPTRKRFRQLFLLLGVIAFANGLVGVYQTSLSLGQLGAWGPGYNTRLSGSGGTAGRGFIAEGGSTRPRPPALGSDSGYGGVIGVVALPGLLALLAAGRTRHRWIVIVLCAGALAGIGSAASRTDLVAAGVAVISFAGLLLVGRLRMRGSLLVLLGVAALALGVVQALIAVSGEGVFARQKSVPKLLEGSGEARAKEKDLAQLPLQITRIPFGAGLGIVGAASGFGGHQTVHIEGGGLAGESTFNALVDETGVLGLVLWVGLTINVIALGLRRLRAVADTEIRTYVAAILAVFIAYTATAFTGPILTSSPTGAFMWFAAGVVAFWLARPGIRRAEVTAAAPA